MTKPTNFFQFICRPVGGEFRRYLNLTVPVRLYPKQCPTLPHVSPKFPRSVRLCPKMTSYNFLLSDWLTTNALMIDGLYLETTPKSWIKEPTGIYVPTG